MPAVRVDLTGSGGSGYAIISFDATYEPDKNRTAVRLRSVHFQATTHPGIISAARANVIVYAMDTGKYAESAYFSKADVNSTGVVINQPRMFYVAHDFESIQKGIALAISCVLNLTTGVAGGNAKDTVKTGIASIVHVDKLVGSLYVAKNGKWQVGVPHASAAGTWQPGIGYILSESVEEGGGEDEPSMIRATHDGAGNVYLENVTVLYDGNGGVTLQGATAIVDGAGNVTIK